jgi:exonuclease III
MAEPLGTSNLPLHPFLISSSKTHGNTGVAAMIWNVQALNSSARQDAVRELVIAFRAEIVCLQETKMQVFARSTFLSMLGLEFVDCFSAFNGG